MTTTAAAVAEHLSLDPTDVKVLERLAPTVAAVNRFVARAATTSPEEQAVGAMMLAGRIDRRRQTPDGVAVYTDTAMIGVAKSDPDVWMLLGLGSWAPPVVG